MKENIFRKTEKKLYNYFDKDMLLESYKKKLEYLLEYQHELELKIKNVDVEINADIKAISYDERVQISSAGIGYAERMLIEITDDLIKEKCRVKREIINLQTRMKRIGEANKIIENNISMLKEKFQEFITKYKDKKSNREIAFAMSMSEPSITRIKKQVLKVVDIKWTLCQGQLKKELCS